MADSSVAVGKKAPSFSIPDQDGNQVSLADFIGQTVVLYFYPKDMTPGCTQQACDFQENSNKLKRKNTVVFGISRDSVARHKKFQEKYNLKFTLLSDEDGVVCEKYGVWKQKSLYGKKFMGIERTTFIINKNGKIERIFNKVKVKGHVESLISEL
mgnify:CR=1 FL=1